MSKTIQVEVLEKIGPNHFKIVGMTTVTITDVEKEKEKDTWHSFKSML